MDPINKTEEEEEVPQERMVEDPLKVEKVEEEEEEEAEPPPKVKEERRPTKEEEGSGRGEGDGINLEDDSINLMLDDEDKMLEDEINFNNDSERLDVSFKLLSWLFSHRFSLYLYFLSFWLAECHNIMHV